jgi:hypothetical protein
MGWDARSSTRECNRLGPGSLFGLACVLALTVTGCSPKVSGSSGSQPVGTAMSHVGSQQEHSDDTPMAWRHHEPGSHAYMVGSGRTWVDVQAGHIILGRGDDVTWRSWDRYAVTSAQDEVGVLISAPGIAFQLVKSGELFVAAGRGRERRVAIGEWPNTWTPSGNLITVRKGTSHGYDWSIVLRRADGTFVQTLAGDLAVEAVNTVGTDSKGWFWFWTSHGNLVRMNGERTVHVSNLRALGFREPPFISALGGGLVLLYSDDWRVVILHRSGAVFARATAPTDGSVAGFGDSLMASPSGHVVVYALAKVAAPRTTSIFALHQGDASGTLIYRAKGVDWFCAPPPMTWRDGRWLVFRHSDGHFMAIDTSGRRPPERVDRRMGMRLLGNVPTG